MQTEPAVCQFTSPHPPRPTDKAARVGAVTGTVKRGATTRRRGRYAIHQLVFSRAYRSHPFLYAVVGTQVACVSSLAAACPATLHAAALDGSLPLHLAALSGSQAVCAALLEYGADVQAVNPVTGQHCWQVATSIPLADWLRVDSTRTSGCGRGGGSGLSSEAPKRSPAEELERAMLIWNV